MKRAVVIAAALVTGLAAIWFAVRSLRTSVPRIPPLFAGELPASCGQVVLVLAPHDRSKTARLWLLERDPSEHDQWEAAAGPLPATIGKNGLAWGLGEHHRSAPAGFRTKIEGDGCSPAGVFTIPFAFGLAPAVDAPAFKLRYLPLTPTIIGVDDPKSRYYNQVVDNSQVERDWDSNEAMIRHDQLYTWGAFIAHNPNAVPGAGSCIFFHLWPGPGKPTAGCTGMAEPDIQRLLLWLDPAQNPRLVQGVEGW